MKPQYFPHAVVAAAMVIFMALLGRFEGFRNAAYQDDAGVWTICHGLTQGVYQGMVLTDDECRQRETTERQKTFDAVARHVHVSVPPVRLAALADLEYNIGETRFASSTAVKKINAGDAAGGCHAFLDFSKIHIDVVEAKVERAEKDYPHWQCHEVLKDGRSRLRRQPDGKVRCFRVEEGLLNRRQAEMKFCLQEG